MIKDKENITIVIASHNNASTIERAIKSVAIGIRPADQIIIGDNDSTDGTYDLLCKLLGAEEVTIDGKTGLPPEFDGFYNGVPIKIFRKRLSTIGHTTNVAIQMKWQGVTIFGFVDPTSWYAADKISQAVDVFRRHPNVACVVSDYDNYHSDGRVSRVFRHSFDANRLNDHYEYDRNFLLRPQVFQKMQGGFNEQLHVRDDYDMLMRIAEIGLIYHIPAPLHNNTVSNVDGNVNQKLLEEETVVRQLAVQRRHKSNG